MLVKGLTRYPPQGCWILDYMSTTERPRILVVGGGYVGLYAARRILKKMRYGEATVTVVDPRSYMTYQPFLPEAAAGSISPRHVVVPLRRVLPKAEVLTGRVTTIDQDRKVAIVAPLVGEAYELPFDYLVIALGAVSRTFPIPGLAENGIGMKGVEEAIGLRNHVLEQLDKADSTTDEESAARRSPSSSSAVASPARRPSARSRTWRVTPPSTTPTSSARTCASSSSTPPTRSFPRSARSWASGAWSTSRSAASRSTSSTSMDSCVDGHVVLKNGLEVDSSTIVWTAGVKPNPVLSRFGLPLGPRGHVDTAADPPGRRAPTTSGPRATTPRSRTWPPAGEGAWCPPNAQHALRQAKVLGDNVISGMRGFPQGEYKHANKGAVAGPRPAQGRRDDRLRQDEDQAARAGWPGTCTVATTAWPMPTWNRKIRVFADWTLGMFLKREVVSLGAMEHPREEFYEAAAPVTAASLGKSEASAPAIASKATADSRADSPVDGKGQKAAVSS